MLVNNAGIGPGAHGYFRDYSIEDAKRGMELNYWGTFYCCKAVIDSMIAQRGGSIVNISSRAYCVPMAHLPVYSSAKAAVVALTQCLALEFGRSGIRFNAVAPGLILPQSVEQVGESSSKFRARWATASTIESASPPGPLRANSGTQTTWVGSLHSSPPMRLDSSPERGFVADGGTRFGDEDERIAATQRVWAAHA